MKKLIAIVLTLVMLLSLTACGSQSKAPAADAPAAEAPAEDKLVIAYSVPNYANEFWVSWTDAMTAECDELGY